MEAVNAVRELGGMELKKLGKLGHLEERFGGNFLYHTDGEGRRQGVPWIVQYETCVYGSKGQRLLFPWVYNGSSDGKNHDISVHNISTASATSWTPSIDNFILLLQMTALLVQL